MKQITTILITLITMLSARAQVGINLVMNPRPIANIGDWTGRRDVLTLIATATVALPQGVRNVKINTTIKTADGTSVAVTDMQRAPVKALVPGGTAIFYAADVVNIQAMVFTSTYQDKLNRTGKLPAGNYQIIVHLDSTDRPNVLSNTQTKVFFLSATQLPVLIAPAADAVLSTMAQTAITFRWTPVIPRPTDLVHYRVQVFEVLPDQTTLQAFRSNQPLLNQEVIGTTQYVWRPQLGFNNAQTNKFVWTIQSLDSNDEIITGELPNGEGRSEPQAFTISPAPKHMPVKKN
jgi:hypothetical protein